VILIKSVFHLPTCLLTVTVSFFALIFHKVV